MTIRELAQSYHIGDVVAYEGLTYDVVKVTKNSIELKNNLARAAIWRKDQFAKIKMIQESMERYQ
jgi:hypothetical protein